MSSKYIDSLLLIDPQRTGVVPLDCPFWRDGNYPNTIIFHDKNGILNHGVVISNLGQHYFIWNANHQCMQTIDVVFPKEIQNAK